MAPGRPAQRGLADITAVEFRKTALPRLGEYLVPQAMARTLALQCMHVASWHRGDSRPCPPMSAVRCSSQGALTTHAGGSLTLNLGDRNLQARVCEACMSSMLSMHVNRCVLLESNQRFTITQRTVVFLDKAVFPGVAVRCVRRILGAEAGAIKVLVDVKMLVGLPVARNGHGARMCTGIWFMC